MQITTIIHMAQGLQNQLFSTFFSTAPQGPDFSPWIYFSLAPV